MIKYLNITEVENCEKVHVEVVSPFTKDNCSDTILVFSDIYYSKLSKDISQEVRVILPEDFKIIFSNEVRYLKREYTMYMPDEFLGLEKDGTFYYFDYLNLPCKLTGLKTEAKKEEKIKKITEEFKNLQSSFITKFLDKLNKIIATYVEQNNEDFDEEVIDLYTGKDIDAQWVVENLDDPTITKEKDTVKAELDALQKKYMELQKDQQNHRCEQMLKHTKDIGIKVTKEKVEAKLKAKEGFVPFSVRRRR